VDETGAGMTAATAEADGSSEDASLDKSIMVLINAAVSVAVRCIEW
jgi:hypothetical protein